MATNYEPVFDVREFGAPAGFSTDANTRKMQRVIDAAARAGGGIVYFSPGDHWVTLHGDF